MSTPTEHEALQRDYANDLGAAIQTIRELRARVDAVRALCTNARRHSGGSFTAHVDALSLERALDGIEGGRE